MPSIKRKKKIAALFTLSFNTLFAIVNTQDGDFCEVHSVGKGDCEDNPWAIKKIKTRDK